MKIVQKYQMIGAVLLIWMFAMGCSSPDVEVVEPAVDTANETSESNVVEADPEPTNTPVPPTPTPEPVSSLGERIEIKPAGFSVQPPADYIVDLSDPEGVQMLAHEGADEHGPAIAVFGGEFGDEMTADQMYEFMVAADETMQNVVRTPAMLDGADGFVAEFESEDGGVKLKGKIILNLIDGQGTIVTGAGPAEEWDAGFGDLVNEVAASIEMFPLETE